MKSRRIAGPLFLLLIIASFGMWLHGAVPDVPTGQWLPGPALAQPRAGAVSVALDDGRVLVIGGRTANGPVDTVEVFNTNGTMSVGAQMLSPRAGHTVTKLPDGRVLVVGGTTLVTTDEGTGPVSAEALTNSAEVFDVNAGVWYPAASLWAARTGHTATAVADGRVLVAGGAGQDGVALDSLEVFDPESGTFAIAGVLSAARVEHAAVAAGKTTVLVAGGRDANGVSATADLIDLETGTVTTVVLNAGRAGASATALLDGKILVAGGSNGANDLASAEVVDPVAGLSTLKGSMAQARRGHQALLLANNNTVLISGGTSDGVVVSSAEQFVPWSGTFSVTGSPANSRRSAVMSTLSRDGLAWLAAGRDGGGALVGDSELYGFATIRTDKDDYSPGDEVYVSGSGWQPGETVTFALQELPTEHATRFFPIDTDPVTGAIPPTKLFDVEQHHFGVRFYLTARGAGSQARITFTDGNNVTFSTSAAGAAVSDFGTVAPGVCVSAFVQERQGGNIDNGSHAARSIALTSAPTGATFHTNSGCGGGPNQVMSVTIAANQPAVAFFFKIATAGSYTLSGNAGLSGGNNASAAVTVQSADPTKLVFTTSGFTGAVSQCLGPIGIQTQNAASTATSVTSNTSVSLATDGEGQFYASADATCSGPIVTSVTITNGTSAASFRYKPTARGTGSHSLTVSAGALTPASQIQTITKANQTITFGALPSRTYGDPDFTVSATASSGLTVTFTASNNCTVTGNSVHIMGAGSCTITASQAGDTNYNAASSVDQTFSIAKAATTTMVTCGAGPFTYSGAAQMPCSALVTGAGGLNQSLSVNYTNNLDAGTATASASYAGDANYLASSDTKTFTIGKAASTITIVCPPNVSYTGSALTPCTATAAGAGGLSAPVTILYANNTNAGTATADAAFGGDANHNGSTATQGTFTIDKVASTTVITCPETVTYTGSALTPCSASTTGAGGLNQPQTVTYVNNLNAGTATADATFAGDANHNGSTATQATFTIDKASSTTTTVGDGPFTFDGTTHAGGSGTVTGAGGLSTSATSLTYTGDQVNAGTYYVTAHYAGDANHEASDGAAVAIVINKAGSTTTTVGDGPFTFDGTTHAGGSGTVTGAGGLSADATSLSYTGDQVNAGTYYVTAHYAGDANHDASDGAAVAIIINKAGSTTTTVGAAPFTYDGTTHAGGSGTVTGAGGLSTSATSLTYTGDQVNAGTYYVTAHYAGDANHEASDGAAVAIVINKAASTTTIACPPGVTYTGLALTPCTATVAGVGGLNQSLNVTYLNNTYPGTATANASFSGDANHLLSSDSKTFAIAYGLCSPAVGAGGVILQPINSDGTSVFARKGGSTLPVKFRVCDASGNPISDPAAVFAGTGGSMTMLSAVRGTIDIVNEPGVMEIPDAAFRYSGNQWVFNMATGNLAQGTTYTFRINLTSGSILFRVGVK